MSNKKIYKTLFPFSTFIYTVAFFIVLGFLMYLLKQSDSQARHWSLSFFLIRYVIGSICSTVIFCLIRSFCKARRILSRQSVEKKKIFSTFYIVIPYVPSFIILVFVILMRIIKFFDTPTCLYIIAFVSCINYLFSIILNVKLKISTMIDDF